jgi:hypothetical protein
LVPEAGGGLWTAVGKLPGVRTRLDQMRRYVDFLWLMTLPAAENVDPDIAEDRLLPFIEDRSAGAEHHRYLAILVAARWPDRPRLRAAVSRIALDPAETFQARFGSVFVLGEMGRHGVTVLERLVDNPVAGGPGPRYDVESVLHGWAVVSLHMTREKSGQDVVERLATRPPKSTGAWYAALTAMFQSTVREGGKKYVGIATEAAWDQSAAPAVREAAVEALEDMGQSLLNWHHLDEAWSVHDTLVALSMAETFVPARLRQKAAAAARKLWPGIQNLRPRP